MNVNEMTEISKKWVGIDEETSEEDEKVLVENYKCIFGDKDDLLVVFENKNKNLLF